jgi:pyruvate-formate lyase-activating enzyme
VTTRVAGPTAALAGVPLGIQPAGVWAGRRQLFVRFAGEAETATLYTADGLAGELKRLASRTGVHSISASGSDVLANAEYLAAVFSKWTPTLPVMVDTDGQRPDALQLLGAYVTLVQVTVGFGGSEALVDRALETIAAAARGKHDHALVLAPREETSDGQLLRIVEQASSVSRGTMIVIHPSPSADGGSLERRWSALLEQAATLHGDVRLVLRIPPPVGMR